MIQVSRHVKSDMRRNNPPVRRGFSMMLVLISLGTATILTTAYISSRDTSATIGENVASAATARWCAASGLELGVAVLETETDWRTAHDNGVIINDYVLGDGTLDVLVEDIETGAPPTETTTAVRITSIATSNGVTQVASAMAQVQPGGESSGVDVDLSEFAVFTSGIATFTGSATITRWPTAPTSALGERISIGTRNANPSAIAFQNSAAAIDTTVYYGPAASASVITTAGGPPLQLKGLLDNIPLPDAPTPPTTAAATVGELRLSGAMTLAGDAKYDKIEIDGGSGRLNLNGNITVVTLDDFRLKPDAGVIVDGNVTIVVADDLELDTNSFIELKDGATLKIFVNGDATARDTYVGALRADRSVRDTSGELPYMNPERIRIFTPSTGVTASVAQKSVINASIYGSRLTLNVSDTSAIYGRVACRHLTLSGQATIFYDHALDSGTGFTNEQSALYDEDGRLKAGVTTLANLNSSTLQSLADALAVSISTIFGLLNPVGGSGGGAVAVGPSDPTPRTVTVEVGCRVEGQDFNDWEENSDGAVVLVRSEEDEKIAINAHTPGDISVNP